LWQEDARGILLLESTLLLSFSSLPLFALPYCMHITDKGKAERTSPKEKSVSTYFKPHMYENAIVY
jgi:hypothetical protein